MEPTLGGLAPRPNPDERKKALDHPGPSWSEWFYGSFLRVWIVLGFLVVDSWVAGYWVESGQYGGILPSLAVAIYLEFLGYQYLWHRPREDPSQSVRSDEAPRRWLHPVEFGRWTPEGERVRAGLPPYGEGKQPRAHGPDPTEFF